MGGGQPALQPGAQADSTTGGPTQPADRGLEGEPGQVEAVPGGAGSIG